MNLTKNNLLLISPGEFEKLILDDIEKNFCIDLSKYGKWVNHIEFNPGNNIWLDIDYSIEFDISDKKVNEMGYKFETTLDFYNFSTSKIKAWLDGEEIEYKILWTGKGYDQFIHNLAGYFN